jgi:hypothetical protein
MSSAFAGSEARVKAMNYDHQVAINIGPNESLFGQ